MAAAFALLLMPAGERDYPEIGIATALGVGLIVLSAGWRAMPRVIELGGPLGFLLVVAVLRDAAGGGVSGFGGLFLLPIIYLALFAARTQLLIGLGAMTLANVVPLLLIGPPEYPSTTWRGTLVQVAAAAVAGFTIQHLVGRARAHAAETAVQNTRLQELDRMKDEFVALVSHELRTPLTSITGYLEMLSEDGATAFTNTQNRFLSTIARNVVRLSKLVDDLLFVARLEDGEIHLKQSSFDLAELLTQAAETAQPNAEGKSISVALAIDPLPAVLGDRDRLAQLLDNLVSNAVKFTPDGGHVTIRASNGGGRVRVEIEDTGVGVPHDEIDRLFERFYRASTARKTETPGTGLGLAISQSIAVAHGTRIAVSSKMGEGTTFNFELSLATSV